MTKKVLIFMIVFIIVYEIYLLYSEQKKEKISKKNNNNNNKEIIPIQETKPFSFIDNKSSPLVIDDNAEHNDINELVDNIDPNMFGKPSEYEKNNIIVWTILDPNPWNKIIYNYNEKYPFKFYIKIKVPSLNDYTKWKNIISNLDFDPRTGEIIIPTDDEETALSIANLIISNFKGDLSI